MKNKALIAFGLSLAALSFADGWSLDLNSGVKSIDFTRTTLTNQKVEPVTTQPKDPKNNGGSGTEGTQPASESAAAEGETPEAKPKAEKKNTDPQIEKTAFTMDQEKIQVPLGLDLKYSLDGINWGLHADNDAASIADYRAFKDNVGKKINAQTNFDATLGSGALKAYFEGKLSLLNSGNADGKKTFGNAGDLSLKLGPKYMNGNHSFSLLGVYKSNKLVTPKEAGAETNYSYKNGLLGLSASVMYQFGSDTYDTYFKNDAKATVSYNNEAGTVNYAPSVEVQYNVGVKKDAAAPASAAAEEAAAPEAKKEQKMMNQVIPSAELLGLTLKGKYVSLELKDKVRFNYVNDQVAAPASEQLGIKNEAKVALGVSGQVGPVTLSSKLTGEAKTAADLKKDNNAFVLESARTADTYGKDIAGGKVVRLKDVKVKGTDGTEETTPYADYKQNVLTTVTGTLENSLEYKYNTIVDLKLEANLKTDASFQTYVGKKAEKPASEEKTTPEKQNDASTVDNKDKGKENENIQPAPEKPKADPTTDAISKWNGLTTTFKGTLTVTPVSSVKLTAGVGVDLVTKMAQKAYVEEENGTKKVENKTRFGLTDIKPSASLGVTFSW